MGFVVCPLADSYIHTAAQDAGAVAAARKTDKYAALESHYIFQPIAVETLGPINGSVVSFLSGVGRRIADVSGESREGSFLSFPAVERVDSTLQRSSSS